MSVQDHLQADSQLSPDPSDDADWVGPSEDEDLDDPEAWDGLEESDDDVQHTGLDDLFGPWLGDEEIVAGRGWRLTVPNRGFFRD